METLNLYQNNVAYNFDMFAPSPRPEKPIIIDYPGEQEKKVVEANRQKAARRNAIVRAVLLIGLITAVFANIFVRAELSQVEMQITKAQSKIAKLDSEITRLECNLQSRMSYETVEKAATELGMQKLERNQIVYVHTNATEQE